MAIMYFKTSEQPEFGRHLGMVVYLLQNLVEKKNFFLKKNICFLQNIHYLQKKMFLHGKKTFFTEKNINENVKNMYLISEIYFYTENVCVANKI